MVFGFRENIVFFSFILIVLFMEKEKENKQACYIILYGKNLKKMWLLDFLGLN